MLLDCLGVDQVSITGNNFWAVILGCSLVPWATNDKSTELTKRWMPDLTYFGLRKSMAAGTWWLNVGVEVALNCALLTPLVLKIQFQDCLSFQVISLLIKIWFRLRCQVSTCNNNSLLLQILINPLRMHAVGKNIVVLTALSMDYTNDNVWC